MTSLIFIIYTSELRPLRGDFHMPVPVARPFTVYRQDQGKGRRPVKPNESALDLRVSAYLTFF